MRDSVNMLLERNRCKSGHLEQRIRKKYWATYYAKYCYFNFGELDCGYFISYHHQDGDWCFQINFKSWIRMSLKFLSFVANPYCSHPHQVPSTVRYKGRRPVAEVLRSLRRAQAEAVTNQLQMVQGVEEIESQVPWRQPFLLIRFHTFFRLYIHWGAGQSFQGLSIHQVCPKCHCSMAMWWSRLVVYYPKKPLQDGFWLQLCLEKAKHRAPNHQFGHIKVTFTP